MHAIQEYDVITSADGRRVPVIYSLGNLISSDGTGDLIARRSVLYRLVLGRENEKVIIKKENYIPLRVVEGMLSSSFIVFPTLHQFRGKGNYAFFEKAQQQIINEIGDKIAVLDTDGLDSTNIRDEVTNSNNGSSWIKIVRKFKKWRSD